MNTHVQVKMIVTVMTIALTLSAAGAWGAVPNEVGNNPQAGAPVLAIKVLEATGRNQFRNNADAAWEDLSTESKLSIGSEIRTGLRSVVKVQLGLNSVIILRGIGIVGIADLSEDTDQHVLSTKLAKKYGRLEAQVEHIGDNRNDYQIATPGSVLSVRGTHFDHEGYDTEQTHGFAGNYNYHSHQTNHNGSIHPGDSAEGDNPDPTSNAENNTNQNNTSNPGSNRGNHRRNDPHNGYFGGNSGTQNLNNSRNGMMTMSNSMHNAVDRPNNPGNGGNP
ncbi:MAG: hypothetical protein GC162_13625 [Planctomycetes bacterium]|nr:hypothetical protein [Planctomycetota bacterium]